MSDNRQYRVGKGAAGKKVKRFVISGMSVVVVTSSMNLSMVSSVYAMEPQNAAEGNAETASLVISEAVADTAAPADKPETGADAFEYVEIYNPTDQTQSLDNYQIRDITQDASTDWKIPEGTTVDAGKTLIIWINNEESQSLKAEDFCSYYGISQDEVQIVKTRDLMEGLDGEEARALQITDSEGEEIFTQALYNEEEKKAQADKGVSFLFEEGAGTGNCIVL